jgi:uncharacterized membrane protein
MSSSLDDEDRSTGRPIDDGRESVGSGRDTGAFDTQRSRRQGATPREPPGMAVRGRERGRAAWSGAQDDDKLASLLGWFSVALGALEVIAPRAVARAIGVEPSAGWSSMIRAIGIRELATSAGILANPRSKEWLGVRVGGDVLDLATLGIALARSQRPGRTLLASAAVLGVGLLDILGTERLAERRKAPTLEAARSPNPFVLRTITIARPVNVIYAFWRDFTNFPLFMHHLESVEVWPDGRTLWRAAGPAGARPEWISEIVDQRPNEMIRWRSVEGSEVYHEGRVTFRSAGDAESTLVTVEMRYAPPGGRVGSALLKLFRKEPGQQVIDDLRRFKQLMETGEVLYSDASAVPRHLAAARPHAGRMVH